jgi:hypothetical protein
MQEILDLFSVDAEEEFLERDNLDEHLFLTLSMAALSGLPAPKTLSLSGVIQGLKARILVDSGSSHSFISDNLAVQLFGVIPLQASMTVQVAMVRS